MDAGEPTEQLYNFGAVRRDPRERVVSVAYYALVKLADFETKAATDAADAKWFPITKVPKLAFDHADIFATALARLKGKVRFQPIGFEPCRQSSPCPNSNTFTKRSWKPI